MTARTGRIVARAALLAALAGPGPLAAQARLYVPNQDDATVSVIDQESGRLLETVDLRAYGLGDNAKPHQVQVEPDGGAWYVTLIGANKVLKLDGRNRMLGSAEMQVPGLIALHPTEDLMFVARSMSAVNPPSSMVVIRRSDMRVLDEVELLFPRPHGIVVHPAGERLFVASLGTNQIASVGVKDGDVKLVNVAGAAAGFVQLAVSPDGRLLAATAELTDSLLVFDLSDPASPRLVRSVGTPDGPFEPVFSRDGRWIWVTCLSANQVAVVDTRAWSVVDTISHEGFGQPHGIALSPDGSRVWIGNRHQLGGAHEHQGGHPTGQGTVAAICIEDRSVDTVLTVGNYAAGLGSPAGGGPPASSSTASRGACR